MQKCDFNCGPISFPEEFRDIKFPRDGYFDEPEVIEKRKEDVYEPEIITTKTVTKTVGGKKVPITDDEIIEQDVV